jgi:exopolyphosphatase/guanosine-5'-triphosphate,3'-diphosphate pyrophosphatase
VLTETNAKVSTNEAPEYIAAVDMGSNSFHMVVAKISHGEVRVIDKLGEKVQLAAGLNEQGEFTEEVKIRAFECLSRFAQRIKGLESSAVQIVGTNAFRAAKEIKSFLREAEAITGYPIEIISGREEARLIYLGVAHTLSDDHGNRLVIDIGGGSTELIIGERFESKALESLHMGCVSFREKYFADGLLSERNFSRAIKHASRELLGISRPYAELGWESCVGASGTIKAILNSLIYLGYTTETIELSALEKLKQRMIKLGHINFLEELGVKKDRANIFASGFSILIACFEVLPIKKMTFTTGALREGLLYDIVGRIQHEDVRERTIQSMQLRYDVDKVHALQVEQTVLYAYSLVADIWGIKSSKNENLLRWASRIFEVGLSIAHAQYHRHGAYLVYYSELPGFTRLTQLYLSVLVRTHRRKFSDEPFLGMTEKEQQTLKKLCVLFRLANVLTVARKAAETNFSLQVDGQKIFLDMGPGWLKKYPLNEANLEMEKELLIKQGFELNIQ